MSETASCRTCRYPLRGLDSIGKCPECGAPFDLEDERTFLTPQPPWWQRWSRPPSRSRVWLTAGTTLLYVAAATNPAGLLGFIFLQEASIVLVFLFYYVIPLVLVGEFSIGLVALTIRSFRGRDEAEIDGKGHGASNNSWRWAVLPACLLLAISVYITQWPLKARFLLSHAAMEREAKAILSVTSKPADPTDFQIERIPIDRWIGLYRVGVAKIDTQDRTVEFILDGNAFVWWGFMYDPDHVRTAPDGMNVAPCWFGYVDAK